MHPGSPDPGLEGRPTGPIAVVNPGDPPRTGDPRANQGWYPWLAVWMPGHGHPDGVTACSQDPRSRVDLEPRRRGDCFSGTLAPRPFCRRPGGVRHAWYTGPHAAAAVYPGCTGTRGTAWVQYPAGDGRVPLDWHP